MMLQALGLPSWYALSKDLNELKFGIKKLKCCAHKWCSDLAYISYFATVSI